MSEMWANLEKIISVLDRQEAAVPPMGERRGRNHELDEAPFPSRRTQSSARRHTSTRSPSGMPRKSGITASRNNEGPKTTGSG